MMPYRIIIPISLCVLAFSPATGAPATAGTEVSTSWDLTRRAERDCSIGSANLVVETQRRGERRGGEFLRPPRLCVSDILTPPAITDTALCLAVDDSSDTPEENKSADIPNGWFDDVELIPKTSLGVRREEADAYYRVLGHVMHVPSSKMIAAERAFRLERIAAYEKQIGELFEKENREDATAARLRRSKRQEKASEFRDDPFSYPLVVDAFNRPEVCQGKIVSFRGHARRLKKMPAGDNPYGVADLYELYLFDDDGRGAPVVVVFSELPAGFSTKIPENEVIDGVSARGYLFKMYAYEGQEKLQAVPLILASTIEWSPSGKVDREFPGWMYGLLAVVGVVLLAAVFRGRQRDPNLEAARRRMSSPEDNPFEKSDA